MEIQTIFIWRLRLFLYGDSDYFYMEIRTIFIWRFRLFLNGESDYFYMEIQTIFLDRVHHRIKNVLTAVGIRR